jgi:3-hydroxyacyl-[acyl-carrier-protein] dehydratase
MMASPLTAPVVLTGIEDAEPFIVTTSAVVDPELPLLPGHYPGFPLFPGVCLIECVHQSVLLSANLRGHEVALARVRSTRFLAPAFPGDALTSTVRITTQGSGWDCDGLVRRGDQQIAAVKLSYHTKGEQP